MLFRGVVTPCLTGSQWSNVQLLVAMSINNAAACASLQQARQLLGCGPIVIPVS